MEYWIIYNLETGEELYCGSGAPGSGAYQQAPEGMGVILVPAAMVATMPRDLDALRAALVVGIENQAEQVRSRFATGLPLQVGAYILKEAAARAWLADNTASTDMLQPEATERGMTLAALCAEVIVNYGKWAWASGKIEGIRFGAKERVAAATTIGAIVNAAVMDWSVFDAAP